MWRATDWISSPARVVRLRVIRPCPSTSTSFECEPGQTKTRPSWPGLSRPLRASLGQGSQGLALFPAHDVGPRPAVGAGVGRRSQSRHEMDRPRPDPWKCTSHHGIGQLGKARGRKHVRRRRQAFLGREHPGGDDQIRARRCSRSLRRPISKSIGGPSVQRDHPGPGPDDRRLAPGRGRAHVSCFSLAFGCGESDVERNKGCDDQSERPAP